MPIDSPLSPTIHSSTNAIAGGGPGRTSPGQADVAAQRPPVYVRPTTLQATTMPQTGGPKSLQDWARQLSAYLNRPGGADIHSLANGLTEMANDGSLPAAIRDAAAIEGASMLMGLSNTPRINRFLEVAQQQIDASGGLQNMPPTRNFGTQNIRSAQDPNAEPFIRAVQRDLMQSVGFGAPTAQQQVLPQNRLPMRTMSDAAYAQDAVDSHTQAFAATRPMPVVAQWAQPADMQQILRSLLPKPQPESAESAAKRLRVQGGFDVEAPQFFDHPVISLISPSTPSTPSTPVTPATPMTASPAANVGVQGSARILTEAVVAQAVANVQSSDPATQQLAPSP